MATPRRIPRHGLSALEVCVAIACFVLLAALIVPSIRTTRGPGRRVQCLFNLRNIALAVANYQSAHQDRLPLLENGADGWPAALLPQLDSQALARKLRDDRPSIINSEGRPNVALRFYTCPDDWNNYQVAGGLSYAANAGYLRAEHWAGDPAEAGTSHAAGTLTFPGTAGGEEGSSRDAHQSTGVFWRSGPFPMTGDFIARNDGLATTLLFAENAQATNWASRNTGDIAFGLSIATDAAGAPDSRHPTGRIGISGEAASPGTVLALQPGFALGDGGSSPDASINAGVSTSAPGRAPRPSSFHAGGMVNVSFCDGRSRAINEKVDASVYARLVTPAGERYGQEIVSEQMLDELE